MGEDVQRSMDHGEHHERVARLFERACREDPGAREAFLLQQGEGSVVDEVRELLRFDSSMSAPLLQVDGTVERRELDDFLRRIESMSPRAPRYRMEGEVGRGGMGEVWRVWDEGLERPLAMKRVLGQGSRTGPSPPASAGLLERFLEEAQITAQLDHPAIVPVHELGLDDEGRLFFTMKLVEGDDLGRVIEKIHAKGGDGEWTVLRAVGVLQRVCEAMAYAHDRRVLHRDLKPANVMVGRFGAVYVMDWGLARIVGRGDRRDLRIAPAAAPPMVEEPIRPRTPRSPVMTMDGAVLGTPAYMPPEQAAGRIEDLDERSDLYAVGAMLYHLLSGKPPYSEVDEGGYAVLMRIAQHPPRRLAELVPGSPVELLAIAQKAMSRDPARRYGSMVELAEELRAFLEGRVVRAHRTGVLVAIEKWAQRNRPFAATVVGSALALLIGSLIATVFFARSAERERSARENAEQSSYIANLSAGHADLLAGNLSQARRMLENCPEGLRGWEWGHLHLACRDRALLTVRQRPGTVAAEWSPQGSSVLVDLGRPRVLELSGREVWSLPVPPTPGDVSGRPDFVASAMSWSPSGHWIAWSAPGGRLRLWDTTQPSSPPAFRNRPLGRCMAIAWSPDGATIASGHEDGSIELTGLGFRRVQSPLRSHEDQVTALDWSPDGLRLASGSADQTVRVWEVASGESTILEPGHGPEPGEMEIVSAVDWVGERIVTAGNDRMVRVWDANELRLEFTLSHTRAVFAAALSPDASQIATAGREGILRIWDVVSQELVREIPGHDQEVLGLRWSPNGEWISSSSMDGTARVWRAAPEDEPVRSLRGHMARTSVVWSPDQERILSSSNDGKVRLWDADSLEEQGHLECPKENGARVAWSADGEQFAAGTDDFGLRLWNAQSLEEVMDCRGHTDWILDVDWTRDGRIASSSMDGSVRVWEGSSGAQLLELRGETENGVMGANHHCVAWSPTGDRIAFAIGTVFIADSQTGERLAAMSDGNQLTRTVAWHPDGALLASGHWDGTVRVWHVDEKQVLWTLSGHRTSVEEATFSPDGSRLATCSLDGSVRIWSAATGEQLLLLLQEEGVTSLDWSPDGKRLLGASEAGTIRVWESEAARD